MAHLKEAHLKAARLRVEHLTEEPGMPERKRGRRPTVAGKTDSMRMEVCIRIPQTTGKIKRRKFAFQMRQPRKKTSLDT